MRTASVLLLIASQLATANITATSKKPHILFILVDGASHVRACPALLAPLIPCSICLADLGHAELGFNRQQPTTEVRTPAIDALVADGVKLDRMYVHKVRRYCVLLLRPHLLSPP